jgi:DNA-binding response OmpR family regulator
MNQKRILIIEDEPALAGILGLEFSKAGFGVCSAGNAIAGLQMAKDSDPDIVLLDLLLPNGDGQALLLQLKSEEKTKNIPVVVLTNLADEETRRRCEAAGCDEFLIKADHSIAQLVDKVNAVLARNRKNDPTAKQ